MDIYGDIYIINQNDDSNLKIGLFVLGQYKIDYTQPVGSHQKLNISNDINNPLGAVLNLRNNKGAIGNTNDQAGTIEFSTTDSASNQQTFGQIHVTAPSTLSTSEVGKMEIGVACSDDGAVDNIITITGGEKADYSTTEIAGDMKFSGNLTLDSTLVESGSIVDQKADIYLDTFTKTNAEARAEKLATLIYESHPHFTIATDEVKTFVSQSGSGMVFDTNQNLFMTSYLDKKIYKITPDQTLTVHYDHPGVIISNITIDLTDNTLYFVKRTRNMENARNLADGPGTTAVNTGWTLPSSANDNNARSLAINSLGEMYLLLKKQMIKISDKSTGTMVNVVPFNSSSDWRDVKVDNNDVVYLSGAGGSGIWKYYNDSLTHWVGRSTFGSGHEDGAALDARFSEAGCNDI